jgi:soluble lytic murein transglycosylase
MVAFSKRKLAFILGIFFALGLMGLAIGSDDIEPPQEDIRSLIQEGSYDLALRRLSEKQMPAEPFWHRLQKAYCLQELHRWDEAALLYEELVQTPSSLQEYLRLFLGTCYARSGHGQKAEQQLIWLLETEDHFLADEARELLAHVYLKSSRLDEAIGIFQLLLQSPASKGRRPEFLLFMGRAHHQIGPGPQAALLYHRIISQYPASQAAIEALEELKAIRGKPLAEEELFDAAVVLSHHRRYQEAAGEWSRFVESYPDHRRAPEALYLCAQVSYRDKQYVRSVARCQQLLQTYPHSRYVTSAHYLQARCAEADGEETLAQERYHRFVRDFPWSQLADDALWQAARLHERRGDFAAAQREFLALSQQYASRQRAPEALRRAGLWAFFLEDYATAIDLFDRLKNHYPQSRWAMGALYWQARAHLGDGAGEMAGRLLSQVIQGDSAGYYGLRAGGHLRETVPASARRDSSSPMMPSLEGLAEQVPLEEPVAQNFQRGKALLRLGLLARAREELSRVHRVAHRHPQVLMDLLRLYWELQLHGDALRLAEQVRRYSDQPSWKEDLEPFLYPEGYTETVDREARKYGLDPHLLLAVIRVESRFDPLAVSPAGALGLMQIMPSTGAEIEEQLGLSSNPAAWGATTCGGSWRLSGDNLSWRWRPTTPGRAMSGVGCDGCRPLSRSSLWN